MPQVYFSTGRIAVHGTEEFIAQIRRALIAMDSTFVGGSLLRFFTEHAPFIVGQVGTKQEDIALCIQEPGQSAKEPIRTLAATRWEMTGAKYNWKDNTKIPLIEMLGPDKTVGKLSVTKDKLHGHPDFDTPQRLDVILMHELCHAYLAVTSVTNVIDAPNMEGVPDGLTGNDRIAGVEEMLVCGLLAGVGLTCCENAYRLEIGEPLRISYGAVGIKVDPRIVEAERGRTSQALWKEHTQKLRLKAGKGELLAAALEIAKLKATALEGIRSVREATDYYRQSFLDTYDPTIEDTYRVQTMVLDDEARVAKKPKPKSGCTLL